MILSVHPESRPRGTYDLGIFQKEVKEFPRLHAVRAFEPDIRRVHAPGKGNILPAERLCDDTGVFHIIGDILHALFHALFRKYLCRRILDDIRSPVEFGGLPPVPHVAEAHLLTIGRGEDKLFGNDRI